MVAIRAPRRLLPIYPSPAEVDAILGACRYDRDRTLIYLLWVTGARIEEALRARVGDLTERGVKLLNEKQGRYIKRPDGTKVHQRIEAQKHVFLPPETLARLRTYIGGRRPAEYIVTRLDGTKRISARMGRYIVTHAARRAGVMKLKWGVLRPIHPHQLRHANAVHLINSAVPINGVQSQLGHASLQSTAVYLALADPDRERQMRAVTF